MKLIYVKNRERAGAFGYTVLQDIWKIVQGPIEK